MVSVNLSTGCFDRIAEFHEIGLHHARELVGRVADDIGAKPGIEIIARLAAAGYTARLMPVDADAKTAQ